MINGQAFANACINAREKGFQPDVVVAHSGWGSGTFAKAVWPDCKYVAYVEWYYRWPPLDQVGNNPTQNVEDRRAEALARNAPTLLDLAEADLVLCPTDFQADQFPERYRQSMEVLHDGVHAPSLAPNPEVRFKPNDVDLPKDAELVTYATRGMEPHRGFPQFMRMLAELMLEELDLDLSRVHFVGLLPRRRYTELMQASDLHVYFTVPFVLSWSLIEAMSIACPLLVSDNQATREALTPDKNAIMLDHDDIPALVENAEKLLNDKALAQSLGQAARRRVLERYDTSWIWPNRAHQLQSLL